MDNILLSEPEIFAALRILFASDAKDCRQVLESVHESEIKRAYRIKALQTHPDRFASHGEAYQRRCSERFIQVNNAYAILNSYLKSRDNEPIIRRADSGMKASPASGQPFRRQRPRPGNDFRGQTWGPFGNSFWQRDVPQRHLRFGEFLYYSGMIPWNSLIRALVWQSRNRPRLGEIAQRWRWLTEFQIKSLLDARNPGERIGELLLHHQIISPFQLKVLLRQQQKIQQPIGEYFVQHGLLNKGQIKAKLLWQANHNLRISPERPKQRT
ncbi:MAG: DnaJ domain-containing protein [Syntrophobacteraceae bacterium]